MRSISIRYRIILLIVLAILFALGVKAGYFLELQHIRQIALDQTQEAMLDGQEEKLQVSVISMALSLGELIKNAGSDEEKVEMIRAAVDPIRFEEDKSGYYFVYSNTTCVALPPKKELHGKDLGGLKDPNGLQLVVELRDAAKAGGGFVNYIWPKPGAGDQPKLSYARMIPGTDMWIGTGVYIDNIDARKATISTAIGESVDAAMWRIGGAFLAALLLIVLPLSMAIFRSIVRPLNAATSAAQQVANNQLDVEVRPGGSDEVTRLETALRTMIHTLRDNIREIEAQRASAQSKAEAAEQAASEAERARQQAEAARCQGLTDAADRLETVVDSLSASSEDISIQAEKVNHGADNQRKRIAETAAAIEEMNATVSHVAQNSSHAAERADSSKSKAHEGRDIVSKSVQAMGQLDSIAGELRASMELLGEKAENIGQVMGVINDIADQTNLLALNAAIEAARAGEAGRGFAVVADEVRKLAEKTMQATKEVSDAISGIQSVSKAGLQHTERAVSAIDEASGMAQQSDDMLSEILAMAEETAAQINSIASASEEQAAATNEISSSVSDVNRIAEENADAIRQTASSTRDMAEQAEALRKLVAMLKQEGGAVC